MVIMGKIERETDLLGVRDPGITNTKDWGLDPILQVTSSVTVPQFCPCIESGSLPSSLK